MKRIFQIGVMFACTATVLLSSCTDEYEYDPADAIKENSRVTLAAETQEFTFTADDETQTIEFYALRENAESEETVEFHSNNEKLTVPSVTFAAGESEKIVQATCRADVGETVTATISVDEASAKLYGDYQLGVTIFRDYNYIDKYVGNYYYNMFFGGVDEGLTLSVADGNDNHYKISNWGMGTDFVFDFQDNGYILVETRATGYSYGSYGMVYVEDYSTYASTTPQYSYYDEETGTFYFCVAYVVSAGTFGYGYEMFTITDEAVKARVDAAKQKAMQGKKTVKNDIHLIQTSKPLNLSLAK